MKRHLLLLGSFFAFLSLPAPLLAIPAFARMYQVPCSLCHYAYPKLNPFGKNFSEQGYRFPGLESRAYVSELSAPELDLLRLVPLALRVMGGVRYDSLHHRPSFDAPQFYKLLAGAPLGERVQFYSYGILEQGESPKLEDAWVRIHHLWGLPLALTLGQFQIADLMFPRELRLTETDYAIYTFSSHPLTYHRGILLELPYLKAGVVNGNGIGSFSPEGLADGDQGKWVFARADLPLPWLSQAGLFGLFGEEGPPATTYTHFLRGGVDLALELMQGELFAQLLYGRERNKEEAFWGGFLGYDLFSNPHVLSLLFNAIDAPASSPFREERRYGAAFRYSYYLRMNVKLFAEVEGDFTPRALKGFMGADLAF